MVTYNIEIREFNGVDYDILHPITTIENVEGLNNSLTQLSQNITNINNTLSNKVNKSGDTMTGNLTMNRSVDPSIYFKQRNDSMGYIFLRDNQFHFNEYPADQQSYREIYSLPKPDSGLTAAKWYDILTSKNFDDTPTANSNNPVKSKGINTALDGKVNKSGDTMTGPLILGNSQNLRLVPSNTSKMSMAQIATRNNERLMFWHRTSNGNGNELYQLPVMDTSATGNNYYDILTSKNFDDTPTANSNNPVKSKGINTALDGKVNKSGDTMTGNLAIKSSNIDTAATSIDSYTTSEFSIRDKNNKYVSYLLTSQATNGNINTALAARKIVNGANVNNSLTLIVNTNGTKSVAVSDPDAWRNGLGAQNGIWPTSLGGTGITSNPSMLVNLASTSASNVLTTSPRPGVTGVLPVANGGTGVNANPSMLVNLASTSASNVLTTSPRPGVTGVLPVANGGTGANNKKNALSNLGVTISNTPITEGSTLASGSIYIYYE